MKYTVVIAESARQDLHNIFSYIALELSSPVSATRQIGRIEETIMSLETYPERHKIYEKEPWKSRNLRLCSANNYYIFYIPNTETETVTVIRIFYKRRDIDKQLGATPSDYDN